MNNGPGKRFEDCFRKSLDNTCIRLYDTTNGFAGVKNPCDFIYYLYPYQYLFELKSTSLNKLDFSHITPHQWDSLSFFNHVDGCNPMIIIEFREVQRVFAVPFFVIEEINKSKRNIKVEDCIEIDSVKELPVYYARTKFSMDTLRFKMIMQDMGRHKMRYNTHGGAVSE